MGIPSLVEANYVHNASEDGDGERGGGRDSMGCFCCPTYVQLGKSYYLYRRTFDPTNSTMPLNCIGLRLRSSSCTISSVSGAQQRRKDHHISAATHKIKAQIA